MTYIEKLKKMKPEPKLIPYVKKFKSLMNKEFKNREKIEEAIVQICINFNLSYKEFKDLYQIFILTDPIEDDEDSNDRQEFQKKCGLISAETIMPFLKTVSNYQDTRSILKKTLINFCISANKKYRLPYQKLNDLRVKLLYDLY